MGVFSVLAAHLVGPEGHVVAFEPVAANRGRLAANLQRNALSNVIVIEQPAADGIGPVTFHLNSDNMGGHALWDPGALGGNVKTRAAPESFQTMTTTVDATLDALRLGAPRVVKIDTEGAEHLVLRGAEALLTARETPYIIAELHDFGLEQMGSSQAGLRAFMAAHGYDTFLLYWDGSLPKLVPAGTRIDSVGFLNLLFSTPEHVAALWRVERFDPRAMPPKP